VYHNVIKLTDVQVIDTNVLSGTCYQRCRGIPTLFLRCLPIARVEVDLLAVVKQFVAWRRSGGDLPDAMFSR